MQITQEHFTIMVNAEFRGVNYVELENRELCIYLSDK